ncbi:HPr family phosphocarrier protein [Streptomyces diastatochromogenes]|uniref:HPr family phosphocarrier protein n=1 Tax=Streptomyces diastatochromogenes TaxID=42236 RepID=UPI000B918875|nr:HPr family phosphocarrier protein [Streptomyces diastatochromogenes]MCZ0988695.1 HPr family phosphocarrier protein [Streptomyces diastatochromogenes]
MSTSSDPAIATAATAPTHETAVVLPANLHARPAGQLARAAADFTSAIQLEYADRTVNPTGVLAVMGLGATAGSTVTVRAEGDDAEQAVTALAQILAAAE